MQIDKAVGGETKILNEAQAAQALWEYYKAHKSQLVSNIRAHRDALLLQLVHGHPIEAVFAPFQREEETVLPALAPHKRPRAAKEISRVRARAAS